MYSLIMLIKNNKFSRFKHLQALDAKYPIFQAIVLKIKHFQDFEATVQTFIMIV